MLKVLLVSALTLRPGLAPAQTMRDWISAQSGQSATWQSCGSLALPSGKIFIGDPSWSDDYHLRGASPVSAQNLDIWVAVSQPDHRALTLWLEASTAPPATVTHHLDFGTDSAYFAFGDLAGGAALLALRDQTIPGAADSHAFLFPYIAAAPFTCLPIAVPPKDLPVFAIDTRASDARPLDSLLENR